jgi:peptidoglycan/LPS O-acetylase OafA/YrhL
LQRNLGLDVIRSMAIIMVLISHAKFFLLPYISNEGPLLGLSIFGLYGVELFFVLSGFLIGQILLRDIVPKMSLTNIFFFYIRRWFRTLPAYLLVISVLLLLTNWNTMPPNIHWRHFVFLQNFLPEELYFFAVSWSLSIEEWFYLLTPLSMYLFLPKRPQNRHITSWLLISIIVIGIFRMLYVHHFDPSWDTGVRKLTPLRFDSLLIGILLAQIKLSSPSKYISLSRPSVLVLASTGLLGITVFFLPKFAAAPDLLNHSFFARTWSFTLISIFMACCIPFFEKNTMINYRFAQSLWIRAFFTRTSLYSYLIYLIHLDIYLFMVKQTTSLLSSVMLLLLTLAIVYLLAGLLHKYYEKPLMDLRDKIQWLPTEKKQH